MKKYRYITSGAVEFDKPVSTYRLAAGNSIRNELVLLRVTIPDDMALTKEPGCGYAVTDDPRLVSDLHPVVCIRRYGHGLEKRLDLNEIPLYEISDYLQEHEHLYTTRFGFMAKEQYEDYLASVGYIVM